MKKISVSSNQKGFTIVELLVVIVVIAIIAAVSIVAYNGIQARSHDAKRLSDMKSIINALEMQKAATNTYPSPVYSNGTSMGGWEISSFESSGEFIASLKSYGFSAGTPVDPVNNAAGASPTAARSAGTYGYAYYKYGAGVHGCDPSRGAFYVLGIIRSAANSDGLFTNSPGFSCSGRDWQSEFAWVTGGYEN